MIRTLPPMEQRMECKPCGVRWYGSQSVCWCCGTPGDRVGSELYNGAMRWDGTQVVIG